MRRYPQNKIAVPRYGRIEGVLFYLCVNKFCFTRFKKALKTIKKVSVTKQKVKNSENRVARVEPIKWSLGNNGYAKNCNAGSKKLFLKLVLLQMVH